MLEFLQHLVANGGPVPDEYMPLRNALEGVWCRTDRNDPLRDTIVNVLSPTFPHTMQGFAFRKPRGHAGDFEMIERIYQQWLSPLDDFRRWDEFFHAQHAPRAVRNRKAYLHGLLDSLVCQTTPQIAVLNVGSGPCTDVKDYFQANPNTSMTMDCVDIDTGAVDYSKAVCQGIQDRVTIHAGNIFRFKPTRTYDLIWSAGLFDYFDNRVFLVALRRLMGWLAPAGRVVIGNFSNANPTRAYMELVGQWFLHHREPDELRSLATEAGCSQSAMHIDSESEGVNLFLHTK